MHFRQLRSTVLFAALATSAWSSAALAAPEVDAPAIDAEGDGYAQDDEAKPEEAKADEAPAAAPGGDAAPAAAPPERQKPPPVGGAAKVTIDFVDIQMSDLVKYMAEITGRNFILTEEIKGTATIISHEPVTVAEAYEAFLSVLEVNGLTTVTVGGITKVVSTSNAANNPLRVYEGGNIPYTDNYVTQIIQLDNVSVSDISSVVKELSGKGAKIIAYAPTNTLIITDAAVNIRRVYKIISQLDVASPKAKLEIIPLRHATAAELEKVVEELYGGQGGTSASQPAGADSKASSKKRRSTPTPEAGGSASASAVGAEGKYIEKIISDERTNSLLILANEEAIEAVKRLIEKLDVDVDPASRAQIHVVYLENAKAEDVSQVLSSLANNTTGGSTSRNSQNNSRNRRNGQTPMPQAGGGKPNTAAEGEPGEGGAVAAFDSGLRIASDENTNSLVIIATKDQFEIIKQVITNLDIRRKQVFVEAVILELSTDDAGSFGMGIHAGNPNGETTNIYSAQLGASSLGLSSDLLSGAAIGAFGPSISVPLGGLGSTSTSATGTDGGSTASSIDIPAFGVVLNALQTSASVNIVSTPSVLTLDNEEAKIIVGRNVPFPVGQSQTSFGVPIVNYQREDVAITLKVTPQINESNFVTLEVFQEVQEIEGDIAAAGPGGPTTSKRSVENVVLVKDNQTIVIGGLISTTQNETETKIPILGDIPVLGVLFRGKSKQARKTNMLIFLTPHIIDDPTDLEEIYRVKIAQRQEFIRRFYGKSRENQEQELMELLSYSMNQIDQPSQYRGSTDGASQYQVIGEQAPATPAPTPEQPAPAPAP
jgi:general secretion pathway protein D